MKTSVNIPDWLHDEVRQLAPDTPFGEQVRDALLIALPVWRQDSQESALKRALKAKLRELEAQPGGAKGPKPLPAPATPRRRPAARAKRAPASEPVGPPARGKRSRTTAKAVSPPPASPRKRRA